MELRQLKYFLKVAQTLNFSSASRELFITQSTLSQQISKLEKEIGQQLFERNSHEVILTEPGRELQRYAQRTVDSVDDCLQHMEDLNNLLTGELNIGCTFSFSTIATDATLEFMKKYPGVKLNLYYKTMEELMEMLKKRELDLVLAFKPLFDDVHIESRVLFNTYVCAIVNEQHPLARQKNVRLTELQKYSFVLPQRGLQARNSFDSMLHGKEIDLRVCMELNNVNQLLDIIRQSQYVTILSESAILHEDGLKAIRIDTENNNMEGCIHVLRNAYVKKTTQEFISTLSESSSVISLYSLGYLLK